MRAILDTNILISALLTQSGPPARIYRAWLEGRYELLSCRMQMDEVRATLRKPVIAARVKSHQSGRMVNDLKDLATMVDPLPHVQRSPDSTDDFLLAASEAGQADYLVTGDKSGLLSLVRHKRTRIVTATRFARDIAG